jgi:regulator of replication initiation timing
MFNLFPRKKTVDETLKDSGLSPLNEFWQPVQTPSILQAQNELIEQFLKENHDLKLENQQLKRDVHQPELCNEKISELKKEVDNLKQENSDLLELLEKYRNGYQGSCYACEPVGILNQKQENQIESLKSEIEKLKYPHHWGGYTDETSWETASGDLALRVVKLEQEIDKLKNLYKPFPKSLYDEVKNLVEGVEVDLDKPLEEDNNPLYKGC